MHKIRILGRWYETPPGVEMPAPLSIMGGFSWEINEDFVTKCEEKWTELKNHKRASEFNMLLGAMREARK